MRARVFFCELDAVQLLLRMPIKSIIPAAQAAILLMRQSRRRFSTKACFNSYLPRFSVRASQPTEGRNRVYKELGELSLLTFFHALFVQIYVCYLNWLSYGTRLVDERYSSLSHFNVNLDLGFLKYELDVCM